ncbi:MAG: signal peptidase I [Coriobacteriales bacterium]|nr:signal peptidase I [Coriobacteriales bacterium]
MKKRIDVQDGIAGEPKVGSAAWLADWGITIAVPLALGLFIHFFVLEAFIVPSGSMLNTIQLNDRLWGEKVSYRFRSPEQGEVVLFESPEDKGVTLVKRVIATEGQEVDLIDGVVYVDGQPLDEPYTEGRPSNPLVSPENIAYPYVVPKGHVWLMGDNRTNSSDSRYFGAVPVSSVFARALCTYWPLDHIRTF